jgi:LPXTG-motif cell wall-anchored protein
MPIFQTGARPLGDANVRCRAASRLRRAALVVGAVGLTAGSGLLTAGSASAASSLQPGNLVFTPASGGSSATPTWHTTDGCPVGYRGSAQMSIFSSKGVLISRISPAVYRGLTGSFSGTLEGKLSAILTYAKIPAGGNLLFVVGCYSGPGGTGNVQWVQSAVIGLSSNSTSYSASAGSAEAAAAAGTAKSASGSSTGQSASLGQDATTTATTASSASGPAVTAWVVAVGVLIVAIVGLVWYRRRKDRSRLI